MRYPLETAPSWVHVCKMYNSVKMSCEQKQDCHHKYTQYFVLRFLISEGSLVPGKCGLWRRFKD